MKILVIDDHALVREGLRQVLQCLGDEVQVLQSGTCEQGFCLAQMHHDLDLVLLDYHLPDMTGLSALNQFGRQHPEIPVLMLSGSANVQIMQDVMRAGACGFVTKSSVTDELLTAVRCVLDGDIYEPAQRNWGPDQTNPSPVAEERAPLSRKQELVLREMLNGRSNREIGQSIGVSEETVKSHVAAILRHFEVQNRTQVVVAAARCGYKPLAHH